MTYGKGIKNNTCVKGAIGKGASVSFPAGNTSFTAFVSVIPLNPLSESFTNGTQLLQLYANAWSGLTDLSLTTFPLGFFLSSSTERVPVTFTIDTPVPLTDLTVVRDDLSLKVSVGLNYFVLSAEN